MNYQNASACARSFLAAVTLMAIALIASFGLGLAFCNCAYADETPANNTHGTISITSDAATENTIALGIGESATILVSPYQHVQYKGCDKPECPDGCAELVEDCFTVGKGCICMGPAPALRTAAVSAEVANTEIATASDAAATGADLAAADESDVGAMQDGTVTITGVAAGTTTVTISATGLRDWKDASATYTIVVEPVSISTTQALLRQASNTGSVNLYLKNCSEDWANAITKVTVAPVVDGIAGEPVELTENQYDVIMGSRWGDYLTFARTAEAPIFLVDELDKNPIEIQGRWGSNVYPQSKQYQIVVESAGYSPISQIVDFYTGSASTFSIIIDADGNDKTTDDQTVAKSWTKDELEALEGFGFANGSSQCGMSGFRTFSGNGISLSALLADAGVSVSETDYFLLDTSDHYGNEFTYDELFGTTRYFMQSIYDDADMKAKYAELITAEDQGSATIELRKLLAAKAIEDNSTIEPRISTDYVETVLGASQVAEAVLPTADNIVYDNLVSLENQFRFFYGLALTQNDCQVTFETGEGSAVAPQTVKSHLMTSDQNTTMKSSYWANSLVIYRGAGEQAQPSTAADAIQKPADPTREGYTFGGWFTDEACTQAFDFAANDGTVDADITLYAKWTPLDTTVLLGENPVMLHNQFETGTADVALTNASETWAQAITDVSVAPVENGVVGEAVKLSADQYTVNLGARWGDTLTFNRTAANPIFTVDEFDKDPVTVRTRWGGTMTYPQSKTYQITVEADGYLTASAQIAFYTGGSSTFSVIVDADGNDKTTDDQTVAKSWTADEIKAMATFANGSSNCGMADFRTFSGEGVGLTKLLADAGVEVSSSDYFLLDTTDHYGNEFTYDELFGVTRYFTQSIYDDDEVKALAAANSAITDEAEAASAKIKMRQLLASKALEDNITVEPRICVNYVESVLRAADLANAVLPTAENTTYDALVAQENQFRFMYGLDLVQDEHVATFDTGEGGAVAPQTVKSHLMTSDENTTMKSSYWANSLVIYRGAGEQAQPSTAADAIQKPTDPTREGYTFGGWFTDEACTQAFDFAANDGALDEDITLYAKWDEASNGGDGGGNNGGNEGSVTPTPAPASAPVVAAAPSTITVNTKNVTAATIAAAAKQAGATKASLTKVILGSKVAKIGKNAFKNCNKLKTIVLKTKKLKKKSIKGSLKGSKVKTVQVQIGTKKINEKFVKKYKKIFTKPVAGKKAKVK